MCPGIDRITGELTVGKEKLGPSLMEEDFLISELGSVAKRIRKSGCRHYYETWRHVSPEMEMGLTLGFSLDGPLRRISAQFVKPGTRGLAWSKEREHEIKCFHDKWLKEQLGDPPHQFRWGTIMSVITPHWYSANIVIDYTSGSRN